MTLTAEESRAQSDQFREEDRQRQRDHEERMRTANGWNDVWWKARLLLQPEADREVADNNLYRDDPAWTVDTWFQSELKATNQAEQFYKEQTRMAADKIRTIREEAERQITEIEQSIRDNVANMVDSNNGIGTVVSNALRENNPQTMLDW